MNKRLKNFLRGYGKAINLNGTGDRKPSSNYESIVKDVNLMAFETSRMLSDAFSKVMGNYGRKL